MHILMNAIYASYPPAAVNDVCFKVIQVQAQEPLRFISKLWVVYAHCI